MGLFGKKKSDIETIEAPVATTGKINGLTTVKRRGFIKETGTAESIFFTADSCADFETLSIGQSVAFMKETDPKDRLRVHAIDVRVA
jgi:cold shock CspA family protein